MQRVNRRQQHNNIMERRNTMRTDTHSTCIYVLCTYKLPVSSSKVYYDARTLVLDLMCTLCTLLLAISTELNPCSAVILRYQSTFGSHHLQLPCTLYFLCSCKACCITEIAPLIALCALSAVLKLMLSRAFLRCSSVCSPCSTLCLSISMMILSSITCAIVRLVS
jgi:hypothetical protein